MILNPKLILFNGPRHSGKDTAADHCASIYNAYRFKMSRPLKHAIKAAFALSDEEVSYLESIKTQPSELLFGKSYVDVQISLSEDWFKKFWHNEIFGLIALRELEQAIKRVPEQYLYVCSDSGFASEAWPLIDLFSPENVLLVLIDRPGKTFIGDSRSYIDLPGVPTYRLSNDGTEESYKKSVERLVDTWAYKLYQS